MNPARLAQRHGGAVVLVTLLLAGAGLLALPSLPSGIYPELHFPRIVVLAHAGTTPARSMMLTVTRPLEQAAMEVPGVRRVRSRTFRGASEISVLFEPETDMAVAFQQLESRIAEARTALPADAEVTAERLTATAFPMLSLNLTGGLSTADLHDYAYYVVRPALARVRGVGRVEVLASDTREIEVVADPAKLLAAGLTVAEVGQALTAANQLLPVGRFDAAGRQHLVLVSGLWDAAGQIAMTPVAMKNGATLTVGDLADVFPGAPDRTSLAAGNGQSAALVSVSQQVGASILKVKAGVETALHELAGALPSGLHISKTYDLAEFVASAIGSVRDAILIGALLAVVVLVVFLGDWRMTLVSALTLPLTVVATFFFMRVFGESINLMSMGGLAVAIGLVIDDAVVVVENIHRQLAGGMGSRAIAEATGELVAPVVGSTLTTVVVLVPLGLLSGVVGQFFRSLSLTLSVAVLLSLFLALMLIPLLAHLVYRDAAAHGTLRPPGKSWSDRGLSRSLDRGYGRSLDVVMARPLLAVLAVAVLGIGAGLLLWRIPSGFLPQMDEGGFVIDYLTPPGTALAESDRLVRKMEQVLGQTPEVAAFSRRTGSELGLFATEQNKGDILVRLVPRGRRSKSADELIAELRPKILAAAPGVDVEFVQLLQDMLGDLEGSAAPIEVKIFGDDQEVLAKLAGEAAATVAAVPGVVDLVGPQRGNPEVTWKIDPAAAGRAGLTVEAVAAQLSSAWLGDVATDLRLLDRTIPVRVRLPDAFRFDPTRLGSTPVRGAGGVLLPLSSLGRPVESDGQSVLMRENLRQMALLTARLEGRDLGSAVSEIRRRLAGITLPVGYSLEVGGQYEAQRQAFGELLTVLGVAVSLVLVILVVEFRRLLPALLLLAAAPLSLGGAFLLLMATGTELNVSSVMGLILLVGLVVKNGIVLLDYAHRLEEQGTPFAEAVARAARVRLRPILMTTLCTLFGLLPLALGLGAGAELQKPLALAVIGGLGLSTVVTLYAVPSIYVALAGRGRRSGGGPGVEAPRAEGEAG